MTDTAMTDEDVGTMNGGTHALKTTGGQSMTGIAAIGANETTNAEVATGRNGTVRRTETETDIVNRTTTVMHALVLRAGQLRHARGTRRIAPPPPRSVKTRRKTRPNRTSTLQDY